MAHNGRFPRPSIVFLDGDQPQQVGCLLLPGGDAPERVVFDGLASRNWAGLDARTGRAYPDIVDACNRAITSNSHHDWVKLTADQLVIGSDILWQAMCAEWASQCLGSAAARPITDAVLAKLT
jgi:hypothetical protein